MLFTLQRILLMALYFAYVFLPDLLLRTDVGVTVVVLYFSALSG